MNCRETRKQLGLTRPDSADRDAPEFAGAMSHLAGCSQCRTRFEAGQRIDRNIGLVMRDVPLPGGLRSRLLESLREADARPGDASDELAEKSASAVDAIPSPGGNRRRQFLAAAIAASIVAAVLGVRFWPHPVETPSPLTLADLRAETTLDLVRLTAFDGNFEARFPGGVWRQGKRIQFDKHAKGDLSQDGYHRVALYGFQVHSDDGQLLRGVLLAIPRRNLGDPPVDKLPTLDDRPENYARRASGTYYSFAWTSGETVYVCFIPKRDGALQMLQQAISGDPV